MTEKHFLFGQRNSTTNEDCNPAEDECQCCDDQFSDMPSTIYCRLQTSDGSTPIDLSIPLYRVPSDQDIPVCTCNEKNTKSGNITYTSSLFELGGSGDDDVLCCSSIRLLGTCGIGDGGLSSCTWTAYFVNPLTDLSVGTTGDILFNVSCLSGSWILIEYHDGNACLEPSSLGFTSFLLTFCEEACGGQATEPCFEFCCKPFKQTMYLSFVAPECPKLEAISIPVSLSENSAIAQIGDYGIPNSHSIIWEGFVRGPCGLCNEIIYASVAGNTTVEDNGYQWKCHYTAEINQGGCFMGFQIVNNIQYCPPVSFSGEWIGESTCSCCCFGYLENIQMVLTG